MCGDSACAGFSSVHLQPGVRCWRLRAVSSDHSNPERRWKTSCGTKTAGDSPRGQWHFRRLRRFAAARRRQVWSPPILDNEL